MCEAFISGNSTWYMLTKLLTDDSGAVKRLNSIKGDSRRAALLEPTDKWAVSHFQASFYHERLRVLFR